jgi:hypothetical protein
MLQAHPSHLCCMSSRTLAAHSVAQASSALNAAAVQWLAAFSSSIGTTTWQFQYLALTFDVWKIDVACKIQKNVCSMSAQHAVAMAMMHLSRTCKGTCIFIFYTFWFLVHFFNFFIWSHELEELLPVGCIICYDETWSLLISALRHEKWGITIRKKRMTSGPPNWIPVVSE